MRTLLHELRLAARSLSKSPSLSLVAVLTLAVGIGASTAIFTLAHAVLLSPLPYPQASWEPRMSLLIRTDTLPESVVTGVEEAIWSIAPEVPVSRVATMDELIGRSLEDHRLLVTLFTGFGAIGASGWRSGRPRSRWSG